MTSGAPSDDMVKRVARNTKVVAAAAAHADADVDIDIDIANANAGADAVTCADASTVTNAVLAEATNSVICGDCLPVLAALPDACVDLAYLDPPFNTGRAREHDNGSFTDGWPKPAEYIGWLRPRVADLHRILRPMGSMLLHCDWRASHHLRLLLDDVFGARNFINHLIWRYGLGGSSPKRFARKHDDILFYGRTKQWYFHPPRVPATSRRLRGRTKKATDVIDVPALNNNASERVGYPTQKPLALMELLVSACCPGPDRLAEAHPQDDSHGSTADGTAGGTGLVIDPFCGSGTTLVAAQRLGRRFIGIDISEEAVTLSRRRLAH